MFSYFFSFFFLFLSFSVCLSFPFFYTAIGNTFSIQADMIISKWKLFSKVSRSKKNKLRNESLLFSSQEKPQSVHVVVFRHKALQKLVLRFLKKWFVCEREKKKKTNCDVAPWLLQRGNFNTIAENLQCIRPLQALWNDSISIERHDKAIGIEPVLCHCAYTPMFIHITYIHTYINT